MANITISTNLTNSSPKGGLIVPFSGKMGNHTISHGELVRETSTVVKVLAVTAAFFLSLTMIGIPLAAYMLARVNPVPVDTYESNEAFPSKQAKTESLAPVNEAKMAGVPSAEQFKVIEVISLMLTSEKGEKLQQKFKEIGLNGEIYSDDEDLLLMGVFDAHERSPDSKLRANGCSELLYEHVEGGSFQQIKTDGRLKQYIDGSNQTICYFDKASNRLYALSLKDGEANVYQRTDGVWRI